MRKNESTSERLSLQDLLSRPQVCSDEALAWALEEALHRLQRAQMAFAVLHLILKCRKEHRCEEGCVIGEGGTYLRKGAWEAKKWCPVHAAGIFTQVQPWKLPTYQATHYDVTSDRPWCSQDERTVWDEVNELMGEEPRGIGGKKPRSK